MNTAQNQMSGTPEQQPEATVVHEIELGEHTAFTYTDGSLDILNLSGEPWSYLCHNGLRLTHDEAYRLYSVLHEQFKQTQPAS